MLTNLTNTKQIATWQPSVGLPCTAMSVKGLSSSFLYSIIGGQSLHRQATEGLGFTDNRQFPE